MIAPPRWTQQDADYYRSEAVCSICRQPMQVGEEYWLDAAMMVRSPVPAFHARCARRDNERASG